MDLVCACDGLSPLPVEEKTLSWTSDGLFPLPVDEGITKSHHSLRKTIENPDSYRIFLLLIFLQKKARARDNTFQYLMFAYPKKVDLNLFIPLG